MPVHALARQASICRPLRVPSNMKLNGDFFGWLSGSWFSRLTFVVLLVGFGHSVLAMSGEESLAQVNREIQAPKLKNLNAPDW